MAVCGNPAADLSIIRDTQGGRAEAGGALYSSPTGGATGELLPVRGCGDADPRRQPAQGHGRCADAGVTVRLRQVTYSCDFYI